MKILLIGANGQLGTELARVLPCSGYEILETTRLTLDICNALQAEEMIARTRADLVINTAAFHNVELCEDEPAEAMLVNGTAVGQLAKLCNKHGCALMHFSTNFVFDGASRSPYTEDDVPNPLSVYAISKLEGERQIRTQLPQHFIVRTCGLYGIKGSQSRSGNFVEKILQRASSGAEVAVVDDQIATPTSTVDLATAVAGLLESKAYGIYHITNEGQCSWHEFAEEALRLGRSEVVAKRVSSEEFKTKAKRPLYSVLSKKKLYELGLPQMAHWRDALNRYVASRPVE